MSGEESLAQVYREIEHPKLCNLEEAEALLPPCFPAIFQFRFSYFGLLVSDFAQGAHSEPHLRRGREGHRQKDFVPAQVVQSCA